ncbi:hypothetical protein MBRA_22750 [Mycobacterium branderi]|uniref:Uncharacterized protein n=1 Tax=Mycobacterium branderi TaxID=43348 RepID=A0ABN6B366_9MYCO|nr:hypothetical protein MBRA_22750 [Mycobacterium branderi]
MSRENRPAGQRRASAASAKPAVAAATRWVAKEMVGDKVTIEVRGVLDHYGDTVVRGACDGTFDRTNLPDDLVLTNYFSVRDGKVVSLAVIFNQPADY